MYGRSGPLTTLLPICAIAPGLPVEAASYPGAPLRGEVSTFPGRCRPSYGPETAHYEGLLHDVRNLTGAIGLYCDLLSMPGVLQPEHLRYAEELRLLGTRSGALIQRLMRHPRPCSLTQGASGPGTSWKAGVARSLELSMARAAGCVPVESPVSPPSPVSLRTILERCLGLLSQMAGGRVIEVSYGAAASSPVAVEEEVVERILVNLVRNSAAALPGRVVERIADRTADDTPGAIRIGVGVPINREDDPKPWPLRRVRLTVEDSGCGMTAEQLKQLLCVSRVPSRARHGIGFGVVRELVAASSGDLIVMSAPGIGTRVQIEWPVKEIALEGTAGKSAAFREATASDQLAAVEAGAISAVPEDSADGDGMWTVC
jgi:signal transduction histidine kinase